MILCENFRSTLRHHWEQMLHKVLHNGTAFRRIPFTDDNEIFLIKAIVYFIAWITRKMITFTFKWIKRRRFIVCLCKQFSFVWAKIAINLSTSKERADTYRGGIRFNFELIESFQDTAWPELNGHFYVLNSIFFRWKVFRYFSPCSGEKSAVKTILFGVFVINHVSECFQWAWRWQNKRRNFVI